MTALIILLILFLLVVIVIQISKVTELSGRIRGEEIVEQQANNSTAFWLLIFMIVFLSATVISAVYYKDVMLGYGPLTAASAHGVLLDSVFNTTLIFTGIVFVITHILLFWYTYKYRKRKGRKALFFSHDNTLEYVWTGIPALVMTFLVVKGLVVWNEVMADVGIDEEVIEIEATGYQFAWDIRYPGPDNRLGEKDYTLIQPGINPLGQNWEDPQNHDDFIADQIYLPVGKKVRVRITAKDVLHNFYLPHFRVKMDAVPGLPSYFVFTPTVTTEEFRARLRDNANWQGLSDPEDPESLQKWEDFDYELACAELCGKGHYSMRKIVKIVSEGEYNAWLEQQNSYYMSQIRNTDNDPLKGQFLESDIKVNEKKFFEEFDKAMSSTDTDDIVLPLSNINFETGSANLTNNSQYELNNLVTALTKYKDVSIELNGHTDNVGDSGVNQQLSESRASTVLNYLIDRGVSSSRLSSKGYGDRMPLESNDTEEGRMKNRRIEFKILKKQTI